MKTLDLVLFSIALASMVVAGAIHADNSDDPFDDPLRLPSQMPPYMSPELRARVDALRQAVAADPTTTPEQASERAPVFWQWLNAYALSGRPIYPDLPQVVARLAQRNLSRQAVDTFGPFLDLFAREFSFRDAYPEAVGTLAADFPGPFQADSHAPVVQTYTVGEMPIEPGGGFVVATRSYAGALAIQADNPSGDGYVTVRSNNPDVEFEIDEVEMAGMFSGALGGTSQRPYFRVKRGILQPGDVVTITAGDTRGGGRGMKLPSQSSSAMRVRVFVSFTNAMELFSLDELPFYSEGLIASGTRGFGPSIARVGEPARLTIRLEDRFRNRATRGLKPVRVLDGDRVLRTIDEAAAFHEFEVTFREPGVHFLRVESTDGSLVGEFNPILVEAAPTAGIYWGETHGHTGFAEGAGTVDNFFRFAREDARLDFMTLSEHDLWMDDREFEVLREQVIAANDPGTFVTYLGYEFTVQPTLGGHHNVLFRTPEGRRRVERQRAPEQSLMLATLREENDIEDVLVIPHAHNPGRWWSTDSGSVRQVEIVSNHGTFEWLGRKFLEHGTHVGFIGGSDDHIGHPGIRPLSNSRSGSDNFGGLAAVMSPSLDRDGVFDALRARNTYATNGQRIILRLSANGKAMGQTLAPTGRLLLDGRVVGTAPVERIDLVRNGETVDSHEYFEARRRPTGLLDVRFDSESDPRAREERSRGWRVWEGYMDIEGATLAGIATPNTENIYTEYARLSEEHDNRVEFFIRTRGAPKNIQLDLADIGRDVAVTISARSRRNGSIDRRVALGRLPRNGERIDARSGEHQDSLELQWIEPLEARDRSFSFGAGRAAIGDTFYVRVLQRNGGMAWSSPVKVLAD